MEEKKLGVPVAKQAQGQEEIDLVEVFYLLWDHWIYIAVCAIVGALVAFGYTWFLVTPLYKATSKIYIVSASNNSVINLSDLQVGTQLTADYKELILSRPLLEDVIKKLDLDMTATKLANKISINNPNGTRLISITATTADPKLSRDIANTMMNMAIDYLPRVMESNTPHEVESAILPTHASSPSYTKNTMMGGLLGFVLCCGVLVVIYLMDDTVSTPDDLQRYFGVQPLAVVPEQSDGKKKGGYGYGYGYGYGKHKSKEKKGAN